MPEDSATGPEPLGEKSIFVISPIGKLDSDGVDFAELVLEHIVKPAAEDAGYRTPVRADKVRKPGPITSHIVADIWKADVCVADLTGRNPNVMYEVAIAHAADKQVILLQQEDGGPPFDFAPERVIHYSTRVDDAKRARDELADHLRNAFDDEADPILAKTMNPVRTAFRELQAKAKATVPEEAILDRLDGIQDELAALRQRGDAPPVVTNRRHLERWERPGQNPLEIAEQLLIGVRSARAAGDEDRALASLQSVEDLLSAASPDYLKFMGLPILEMYRSEPETTLDRLEWWLRKRLL